jgi:hypothetical protein
MVTNRAAICISTSLDPFVNSLLSNPSPASSVRLIRRFCRRIKRKKPGGMRQELTNVQLAGFEVRHLSCYVYTASAPVQHCGVSGNG